MQVYYNSSMKNNLKIQFQGLETLQGNCSNLCQDMFVLSVLNGKSNGTYLEIGGGHPVEGNNTYILEKLYNWKGISIEFADQFPPMWIGTRTNPIYHQNALTTDYTELFERNNLSTVIDYLSCDIEPQEHTFSALKKIDHTKYRFRVITFEHDHYNGGQGPRVRDESREYLTALGYEMLIGDLSHQGNMCEDWWIAPELIDPEIIKVLKLKETWNADEAIYINPPSASLRKPPMSLDNGYISLV